MRYTDVAKMMKQASPLAGLAVMAAPTVAPAAIGAATNPVVAVPATATGGFLAGNKLYKALMGNRVDKAHANMQNQINDTAKTYREYLKWRQARDANKAAPAQPVK